MTMSMEESSLSSKSSVLNVLLILVVFNCAVLALVGFVDLEA